MAADVPSIRPKPRPTVVHVDPVARWDFRNDGAAWSAEVLSALRRHGAPLVKTVPRDIATWCPGYASAPPEARRAFWNGFLSALAKYESTYRPTAVGGGGRWYGLLQILPATARHHGCKAGTGGALKDGGANLSCAIRIMSRTVTRDGVIHAKSPRWSGVSADWGPMRSDEKRAEMARWLRGQPYCALFASPRPKWKERPEGLVAGPILPELRPEPRPESRPALRLAMLDPADLLPPRRPGAR
ncbi:ABC transporter permease [Mesobaculum littorinae]|uniref:ABC transporter permease n=2 Tax=Mesobaculum littorinae TaxID=2486419 RepID=A0A438AK58_9RHOB|nr:transglycosylase SLT domain-containing protein [Mesobaculum littorinae]RVV99088.1 ABC transporter permease [Mesobaculum littorinae]